MEHIWSYYRFHLLALVLCVLFAVFLLRAALGPRVETVFSAILVDTGAEDAAAERLAGDLGNALEIDPARQRVTVDAVSVLGDDPVRTLETLVLRIIAGEADVVVCHGEIANYLLKSGALSDLSEVLPPETLDRWADRALYVDAVALAEWTEASNAGDIRDVNLVFDSPEGMARPVAVALDVTEDCTALSLPEQGEPLCCVVAVTTTHTESVARFLDYLG